MYNDNFNKLLRTYIIFIAIKLNSLWLSAGYIDNNGWEIYFYVLDVYFS